MIRKYLESFVVLRYYPFVVLCPVVLFPALYLYTKNPSPAKRVFIILAVILVAAVLLKYRYDKYRLGQDLRRLKDLRVYENGILLGRCILSEDSFLFFDGKKLYEAGYAALNAVELPAPSGHIWLDFCGEDGTYRAEAGSLSQAERTCAFLQRKNPQIAFRNIEPSGDGTLRGIYRND